MPDICLCFQVHQPNRLSPADSYQLNGPARHEDEELNTRILNRIVEACYLPANRLFKRLIEESGGRFRIALSISGTAMEQMRRHRPDALDSFRDLVATGGVEILAETHYHSLAFVHSHKEFERQVELHLEAIEELFSIRPRVFRNTEVIYNNAIAARAETMGFDGILAEGLDQNLNGQSPNFLYRAPDTARIKTLLRNYRLSDDIAFRFSDPAWPGHPLTAEKFANWLRQSPGDLVNLFMDYESIGEHQPANTGIFDFWENLPAAVIATGCQWVTPSEAVDLYRASREYDCPFITSWADAERDLSAWMGNAMQQEAIAEIHHLEAAVLSAKDPAITEMWAKLQTSDHFYWMSTKQGTDGSVHAYFTPYPGPLDAYHLFMAALADLRDCLARANPPE